MGKHIAEVMPASCGTCPWRDESPYANLRPGLSESALNNTRICHSTGGRNAIHPGGTGKPAKVCRGARDEQLRRFHQMGFIAAPTDAAWAAKWAEISAARKKRRKP